MFVPTGRASRSAVAALVALALPFAATSAAQAAASAPAQLAAAARKAPNKTVTAIVQFNVDVKERKARNVVRAHHGKVTDRLASIHGFAVQLPAREAKKLRAHKTVLNVTLNRRVKTTALDPSLLATNFPKTVGADKAWAAGFTGKGVGVAVIDSGINGDHPDFKNPDGTSRVTNVLANPAATRAGDDVGHGTHVAGIVAGNSAARPATDAKAGAYEGIAPEADVIAVKTADDQGNSTTLDVINALEFVVNHKDELNIDVVNLSVSSDTPGSYLLDPLDAAVEFAWHAGIVVVSAAGNRGNAADAAHYAPGNDPFVISVGATDETGTANPADDTVATFSSRGAGPRRLQQARRLRPGRAHRRPAGGRLGVPPAVPDVRRRRRVPAHRWHLDGRSGRRRRRGAAAPGPPGAQPGPGQGAADGQRQPDRRRRGPDRRLEGPGRFGRPRRQPGHGPGPGGQGRAARGRPGPDPRHLDEGDLDQGDLDQGHVDEGDLDEGHLDRQQRPEERPVGEGDLDVLDLHGRARGRDRADQVVLEQIVLE